MIDKKEIIVEYLYRKYFEQINKLSNEQVDSLVSKLNEILPDEIIYNDGPFIEFDDKIYNEILFAGLDFSGDDKDVSFEEALYRENQEYSYQMGEYTSRNNNGGKRKRNDRRTKKYKNRENKPSKSNNKRKELISPRAKASILALAMIASLGTIAGRIKGNQLLNESVGYKFPKISSKVYNEGPNIWQEKLDGHLWVDLDKITDVDERIEPIYSFYDNFYDSENKSYRYIGFYETYESIKGYLFNKEYRIDNVLKIMDTVMQKAVDYTYEGIGYDDKMNDCYYELSGYSCFLDFVSNRVSKITGSDTSKYNQAIEEYLSLDRNDRYSEMSEESRLAIEELLNIYEKEYRESCRIFIIDHYDFGDIISIKGGRNK